MLHAVLWVGKVVCSVIHTQCKIGRMGNDKVGNPKYGYENRQVENLKRRNRKTETEVQIEVRRKAIYQCLVPYWQPFLVTKG